MGPIIEIFVLGACLSVSAVIIWYLTIDTRNKIGFVVMPEVVIAAVVRALELGSGDVVVDLGAGDGRVLAAARRAQPGITATGYENNPVLRHPEGVIWHRRDLFAADLNSATHVIAYLNPELNARLLPKLEAELGAGAMVVTVQFELVGRAAQEVIDVVGAPAHAAKVFMYRF